MSTAARRFYPVTPARTIPRPLATWLERRHAAAARRRTDRELRRAVRAFFRG